MNNSILICLLLFSSFINIHSLKENNKGPLSYEELVELVHSPEFIEFSEEYEDVRLESIFSSNECLVSKSDATRILSQSYGISNSSPDENLRFILGKCNPVLLIPGIYATKLVVELKCKNIATEERKTTFKNLRLYCGDTLCPNESTLKEEHPLFLALLDPAFSILGSEKDKYSSCLGYIMTFFQNEGECPKVNGKYICNYSKNIKVGFYGGTDETKAKGKCGLEGIQNIIQTGVGALDFAANIGAAKSYADMTKSLIKMGYREGFSIGGLPNDYRRYLSTNNFATKVFERQINDLYSNTGKPVVIVAHSYGTLLTLTNLIKKKNDKTFLQKIKKFVAVAPPFSGSGKLLDAFFHGINDWNKAIEVLDHKIVLTNYNIFGQLLMYKTLPTITELRPLSMAAKIFTDSSYSELANAIRGRLEIEKQCKNINCNANTINSKAAKFDSLFKGYFPSLTDSECSYESSIGGNSDTLNRKCYTGIYNIGDCPTIIGKSINPTLNGIDRDLYCNKIGNQYYYQGDCSDRSRNCLDEMYYSDKCPNVFSNSEAVFYLLSRFNNDFYNTFGGVSKTVFESYDNIREGVKQSIAHQNAHNLIKDLPVPPVDTDLVYASFAPTINALIVDDNDFTKTAQIYKKGGDGTVPTWSSLLTGLKWIYDKKKQNLPQKIRLIEYCSRLAKSKYKYDATKNQNFAALDCSCLNSNNKYKKSIGSCTHAAMLSDDSLIDYVATIVNDPKEYAMVTASKKTAVSKYISFINYESICNNALYRILEEAK